MNLASLVRAAALGLALFWAGPSHAAPDMLTKLWLRAIEAGGFKEACSRHARKCATPPSVCIRGLNPNEHGRFVPWEEPTCVQVSATLDPGTTYWKSTVLHEFVHYLQWWTGELKPTANCFDIGEAEQPAYNAQIEFLAEQGYDREGEVIVALQWNRINTLARCHSY